MDKIFKTILITIIAVFGAAILSINSVQAQTPPNIAVEIWDETINDFKPLAGKPIFDLSNFLPGEIKTEKIRVTNNTPQSQTVGLKVINFDRGCIGSYCLADKLYLTVKPLENSSLYSGSLTDFYEAGEIPLSGVSASGGNVQYDFSVSFDKDTTAKEYQGSTTDFDLEIGFFTKETVSGEPFGGGGGYIPPIPGVVTTIIISGPTTLTSTSATVTCGTDIPSYCRVIYDTVSNPTLGNPPNYGYDFSTLPPEVKTTSHEITLTNLESGTAYYYRVVCWASPLKISEEFTFTTLGVKEIGEIKEEIPSEGIPYEEEILPEEVVLAPTGEEEVEKPEGFVPEGAAPAGEGVVAVPPEERVPGEGLASLLLASLGTIQESAWMAIVATFCLIGLVIIGIREWELARKKKKNIS